MKNIKVNFLYNLSNYKYKKNITINFFIKKQNIIIYNLKNLF